ncbi:MAG: ATP-grasp domain-containing protein [Planctomycetes bacterium]|nr:ATP-grasp domain-containing protein [Planctomycetota bacterium]
MTVPATTQQTVLVTDCGRGSAIAFLRSLGRAGYRLIAADADPRSAGFRSKYTGERLVYASPRQDAAAYVEALIETCRRQHVDLVVPITDECLVPLAEARERFPENCRLAIPASEALETARDKAQTVALARRLGVPVPRTCVVHKLSEVTTAAAAFGFPLVLKPALSRAADGRGAMAALSVGFAGDAAELHAWLQALPVPCSVLLQESTPGVGVGVELLCHEGRPLAAFQHRRLREVPVTGGVSSLRESIPLDPMLYGYAARLLGELRWTGLAMVEFKLAADGPKLMEINGRVWGSLPLAVHSGVDFPRRLAELLLDGPPAENEAVESSYRMGLRCRNLPLDLVWMASVLLRRRRVSWLPFPPRRRALAVLADLFNPTLRFDVLSLRDPGPALASLRESVRCWLGKCLGRRRHPIPASPTAADTRGTIVSEPSQHAIT